MEWCAILPFLVGAWSLVMMVGLITRKGDCGSFFCQFVHMGPISCCCFISVESRSFVIYGLILSESSSCFLFVLLVSRSSVSSFSYFASGMNPSAPNFQLIFVYVRRCSLNRMEDWGLKCLLLFTSISACLVWNFCAPCAFRIMVLLFLGRWFGKVMEASFSVSSFPLLYHQCQEPHR